MENNSLEVQGKTINKKKHRALYIRCFMTYFVIAIFIICVFMLLNHVEREIDTITKIFCFVMIGVLFIESVAARNRLLDITNELKNVQFSSKTFSEDLFGNGLLKERAAEYKKTCEKLKGKQRKVYPDISEYINEEVIDNYIHRNITDQIGSIMTGLGILGTFIGLTLGLESFDSSNAIDSTPILLSGIKTAFYTSIFGIVCSIIYNFFYYKDIENNRKALDAFYERFYGNVVPNTEMYVLNQMLEYNKKQTKALDALAGSIAGELAPKFAEAINRSVMPTMDKLNKSIDDYIIRAVDAQSKTLEKIVQKFMTQMNEALDNQFENLSHSIEKMCAYQNDSAEKIKMILGSLNTISDDLSRLTIDMENAEINRKKINEDTSAMMDKAKRFADEFSWYSQEVHKWTNEAKEFLAESNDIMGKIREYSQLLTDDKEDIVTAFENFVAESDAYREKVDGLIAVNNENNSRVVEALSDSVSKIESYTKNTDRNNSENANMIADSIKEMTYLSGIMQNEAKALAETVSKMTISANATAEHIEQNDKTVIKINNLISEIQNAWKKHIGSLSDINGNYDKLVGRMETALKEVQQQFGSAVEDMNKNNTAVEEAVNSMKETIVKSMREQTQSLQQNTYSVSRFKPKVRGDINSNLNR